MSVKKLMPLVATGGLVTTFQLAPAPRLAAAYSPSPFLICQRNVGQGNEATKFPCPTFP